jgi:homoserine O-succinyltransferase/O-acetyltransferase
MPLVANSSLPTFSRLRAEGDAVLAPERAKHQDIREMHIGLLNMMPDAALEATERQFMRIVSQSNQIAQFYVHLFTLPQLPRGEQAAVHIEQYYESFASIQERGLDALIITGANVTRPNLADEDFWQPLIEVIDWGYSNVTSILCSCLATHAVMQFRHQQKRQKLPEKRWGIFQHEVVDRSHPLVADINTRFDVPHSRYNEVTQAQFEEAGLSVLVASQNAGVHLAVSEDLFRIVYFQGHPEYDINSLLKEYKREVLLFLAGEREDYPPFPANYFSQQTQAILQEHKEQVLEAQSNNTEAPQLPENVVRSLLHNTWHDTGAAMINNWIGRVYQTTNSDRKKCFMEGVDPNDPLGIR